VSIKKKFATAVATASLLAGIFGSAFVPGAMAATVKASYTEVYSGSAMAPHSGTATIDLTSTLAFQSAASTQLVASANTMVTIALFESSVKFTGDDTDTGDDGAIFGKRYGDANYTPDELVVTSSNSGVLVSWAVDAAGDSDSCADIDNTVNARGVVTSGSFGASDSISDVDGDGLIETDVTITARSYIDADGDAYVLDLDDDDATDEATQGYELCFAAASATTAATSTVTVKADGVTVATLKVTAVGPANSMALSLTGSKYIAADNDGVDDWLKLEVKDKNGTVINGKATSLSNISLATLFDNPDGVEDWSDNPENGSEVAVSLFAAGTAVPGTDPNLLDLEALTCTSDEDDDMIGKSYSVKVQGEDATTEDVIVSNAISITCTEDGDSARVTKITPEALSGGKEYVETGALDDGDLSLVATVVAGNGGPLGDGSGVTCDEFDWDVVAYTTEDLEDTIAGADEVLDGECEVGLLEPGKTAELPRFGKFTYTLTALDPDLGDVDEDEVDFVLTYTATSTVDAVTIARVRNAAKTVATITFDGGEGAAFESVYFQVEKANGTVVELRRRANGDGVARLVLARRNTTVYVYAYAGVAGDESDTIKVVFR
jgi:hypothetical protein